MSTEQHNCGTEAVGRFRKTLFTYSVEAVVDEMLEIFAHSDLSHQLVLVAVHARQLTNVGKDVLQPISQLQQRHSHAISGNE